MLIPLLRCSGDWSIHSQRHANGFFYGAVHTYKVEKRIAQRKQQHQQQQQRRSRPRNKCVFNTIACESRVWYAVCVCVSQRSYPDLRRNTGFAVAQPSALCARPRVCECVYVRRVCCVLVTISGDVEPRAPPHTIASKSVRRAHIGSSGSSRMCINVCIFRFAYTLETWVLPCWHGHHHHQHVPARECVCAVHSRYVVVLNAMLFVCVCVCAVCRCNIMCVCSICKRFAGSRGMFCCLTVCVCVYAFHLPNRLIRTDMHISAEAMQ